MILYNYANMQAIKTENVEKKTDLYSIEKRALIGYLFDLFNNNFELFDSVGILSVSVLYDDCMIQGDELRFFCGEGIALDDNHRLDSIFFNKHNVLCMSIIDNEDNEEIYI